MPDSTLSTLQQIIIKVRRLTRSMSENQLSTDSIKDYINTFVLYDFPEHLRLATLRTTLTFFTEPFIDVYQTDTTPTHPLFNFKNKYISIHTPIYIAGYQSAYSQSREQFFTQYPMTNSIASIGVTGDGVTTDYTGTILNNGPTFNPGNGLRPILRNQVLFSSIDANGNALAVKDEPIAGSQNGLLVDAFTGNPAGFLPAIEYTTGNFQFSFTAPPAFGATINSQTVPYVPSRPQSMLFYDTQFTLRPVPDQSYRVNMEVYQRPTELLDLGSQPELSEWWQYIAYGAAKKVFEDRMDPESVQTIMPEFKQQEALINRRTIVQQTDQRTSTIYTQNTAGMYGPGWYYSGGNF